MSAARDSGRIDRQRDKTGPMAIALRGMIRKTVVRLAKATGLWNLVGFLGANGEEEPFTEVEVFPGIGFWSRPRANAKAEAIVANVGGESGQPVIIATRDMGIHRTINDDEAVVCNSLVQVYVKNDSTVCVDDGSGAIPLATKADIDALRNWLASAIVSHTHGGVTTGGGVSGPSTVTHVPNTPPNAAGTSVLKGK